MYSISVRAPGAFVDPFTRATYALVDAYARDGHIPRPDPAYFVGDASAIVLASDALLAIGTPAWERCDAPLVCVALEAAGMVVVAPAIVRALLAFRRWLRETGRAGADGIASLEELASELAAVAAERRASAPAARASRRRVAHLARRGRRRPRALGR